MGVLGRLKGAALAKQIYDTRAAQAAEATRAYLGIVGVSPQDSYGVRVTYDRRLDLMDRTSTSSHVRRTTGGDELPCADGKSRVRMHGGAHVVLTYCWPPAPA